MQVSKWRVRFNIPLPTAVLKALGLPEIEEIQVKIAGLRRSESPQEVQNELLKLRRFRGRLPADFVFDRDEANGR